MNPTDLDIEPEPEPAPAAPTNVVPFASPLPMTVARSPVMEILPADFPLLTLLQFLPDIRLKQNAAEAALAALEVDVAMEGGLAIADDRLDETRAAVRQIELAFEYPTRIANDLHKRLTGLRADFSRDAEAAIKVVGKRIYDERRRQEARAAEERRKQQEAADAKAREDARRAAEQAAKAHASPQLVQTLQERAKTATAPPVAQYDPPALSKSTTVAKWKGRLQNTPAEAEPNPAVAALTPQQQEQLRHLCAGIAQGVVPLAVVEINWSYINQRAAKEKTTLDIPEIEAFDEGSTRSKGARR